MAATARSLGLRLVVPETAPPNELTSAFSTIEKADVQAVLVGEKTFNFVNRQVIANFAARSRLVGRTCLAENGHKDGPTCAGAGAQGSAQRPFFKCPRLAVRRAFSKARDGGGGKAGIPGSLPPRISWPACLQSFTPGNACVSLDQ
jgi:hypothetical protein